MPADYIASLQEVESKIDKAGAANSTSLQTLLASISLVVLLGYWSAQHFVPLWSVPLPIPLIFLAGRWYAKNKDRWRRLLRLRGYYERGVARVEERWQGEGFSGEEFRVAHHVYEADLQVLGKGSLFEMLCTARTGIGRRRLAEYLLSQCDVTEAKSRQESVCELMPLAELRERIGLLGKFDFQESSWEVFSEWIAVPAKPAPAWLRVAMLMAAVALVLVVVAGFSTGMPFGLVAQWAMPLLAFRMGVALYFRPGTNDMKTAASRVGVEIGTAREGIEMLSRLTFRSKKLAEIQTRLISADAAACLRRLERLTNVLAECDKPQFDLFAQAMNLKTQIGFSIEEWKGRYGRQLEGWLDAWGEFEALAAISGYAFEHPDDVFPEFVGEGASVRARSLGHPLLPAAKCVRNDIELNEDSRFYIVSGSNMAGKSTLLRSIGVSVVLAKAGAPVRAGSLRLTSLEVFASLSIVDSIAEGKSKFLAEVERVRMMMDRARETRVLFLIDEILSGTNSGDRRIASEAIVQALIANGAIGALSTHDLALTDIAGGTNVHMCARPGGDPLDFDYLLKPGVNRETNALAIVAMMGLSVGDANHQ